MHDRHLLTLCRSLARQDEPDLVASDVLSHLLGPVRADAGYVVLAPPVTGGDPMSRARVAAHAGLSDAFTEALTARLCGQTLTRLVVTGGSPVVVPDVRGDGRIRGDVARAEGVAAALIFPLVETAEGATLTPPFPDRVHGAVALFRHFSEPFSAAEAVFVREAAAEAAAALARCARAELARRVAAAEGHALANEIAAGVAHHFNNLLQVVIGEASLVSARTDPGSAVRRSAAAILDAASTGTGLVSALLATARSAPGETERFDLRRFLVEQERPLRALMRGRATLSLDPGPDSGRGNPAVVADKASLARLLTLVVGQALGEGDRSASGTVHLRLGPAVVGPVTFPGGESVPGGRYVTIELGARRPDGAGGAPRVPWAVGHSGPVPRAAAELAAACGGVVTAGQGRGPGETLLTIVLPDLSGSDA